MKRPGTDSSQETILVVEDMEAIRRVVCSMLDQYGYRCLEAGDGTEALQVLEKHPVHLLITDVIMEGMGGTDLAKHVAVLRPELPIIFMSGFSDHPVVQSLGGRQTNFLRKPFTSDALVTEVQRALGSRSDA